MHARRDLLKKLALITNWDATRGAILEGESWVETRNTLYRFRDGVCIGVGGRDPKKRGRASVLVGMRLVGFVAGTSARSSFSYEWQPGSCAVLWRAGAEDGQDAVGMTSPTTSLLVGSSSAHLQTLHDRTAPMDSQLVRRAARASRPSEPSYRPSEPSFRQA